MLTHTYVTHTRTHIHSHTHTHTHLLTRVRIVYNVVHTHVYTNTHSHTHSHTHSLTHSHSHTHTYSNERTHSHTHTHTHTQCVVPIVTVLSTAPNRCVAGASAVINQQGSQVHTYAHIHACITTRYSGKLSREKTFANLSHWIFNFLYLPEFYCGWGSWG